MLLQINPSQQGFITQKLHVPTNLAGDVNVSSIDVNVIDGDSHVVEVSAAFKVGAGSAIVRAVCHGSD